MKTLILLLTLSASPLALATSNVPDKLIQALIQVESGGRDDIVGDSGQAVGCLQLHKAYWIDGCKNLGVDWPYSKAVERKKAIAVTRAYLTKAGKLYEKKTGQKATLEVLARIHNGGYNGYKKKGTENYWKKVEQCLKK